MKSKIKTYIVPAVIAAGLLLNNSASAQIHRKSKAAVSGRTANTQTKPANGKTGSTTGNVVTVLDNEAKLARTGRTGNNITVTDNEARLNRRTTTKGVTVMDNEAKLAVKKPGNAVVRRSGNSSRVKKPNGFLVPGEVPNIAKTNQPTGKAPNPCSVGRENSIECLKQKSKNTNQSNAAQTNQMPTTTINRRKPVKPFIGGSDDGQSIRQKQPRRGRRQNTP